MKYFFDVGANVGQTFDWYLCPRQEYDGWHVVCVEPSPRHLAPLLERVSRPDIAGRYGVTVLPCAIGERDGTMQLFEKDDPRGDSLFAQTWMGGLVGNRPPPYRVVVAVQRLSQVILAHTKKEDELVVKLDVEGAEYGILEDLLQCPAALIRITQLHVEWHKLTGTPEEQQAERATEVDLVRRLNHAGVPVTTWPY